MQKKTPTKLIDKYLAGICSAEEEAQLFDWYNSFKEAEDPLLLISKEERSKLKLKMLAEISNNTRLSTKSKQFGKIAFYAAASIAAVLLLVSVLIKPDKAEVFSEVNKRSLTARVLFANNSNKIHKYKLPDNSIVWLKPKASISYNTNFINKIRKVDFTGEAFFEIQKDKEHPFLIYSGDVVTEVVGTSFNIKANDRENTTEVSVVTGKVLVRSENRGKGLKPESVYLLPKEKVTYIKDVRQLVKLDVIDQSLDIWKKSTLSFDNAKVADVIQALNRAFKSKIVIADNDINSYTLKADFTDVNLPTVMELLSKSLSITYKMQGDDIIVSQEPQTNRNN